jgi:hypothetical protein
MMLRPVLLFAAAIFLTGLAAPLPAFAAPYDPVAKMRADNLLATTENAKNVWQVQPDGGLRHWQSGLMCPASFPGLTLTKIIVRSPPERLGADVGCEYTRGSGLVFGGGLQADMTIYLTKMTTPTTLQAVFNQFETELHSGIFKDAKFAMPQVLTPQINGQPAPPNVAEKGFIDLNGTHFRTELIVGVVNGWVMQIRATFPANPQTDDAATPTDSPASLEAWQQCLSTVVIAAQ